MPGWVRWTQECANFQPIQQWVQNWSTLRHCQQQFQPPENAHFLWISCSIYLQWSILYYFSLSGGLVDPIKKSRRVDSVLLNFPISFLLYRCPITPLPFSPLNHSSLRWAQIAPNNNCSSSLFPGTHLNNIISSNFTAVIPIPTDRVDGGSSLFLYYIYRIAACPVLPLSGAWLSPRQHWLQIIVFPLQQSHSFVFMPI